MITWFADIVFGLPPCTAQLMICYIEQNGVFCTEDSVCVRVCVFMCAVCLGCIWSLLCFVRMVNFMGSMDLTYSTCSPLGR